MGRMGGGERELVKKEQGNERSVGGGRREKQGEG